MFGLLIILGVILFGGFFALLGDRVGMKVGKKRLSLFGLRPRYTSMIITVFTGFLIAGLTLLVLTFMSEYVRTALFELTNIKNKVASLTKKLRDNETQYDQLQQKLRAVVKDRNQVEAQLREIQARYDQGVANLKNKKKELDLAQQRLINLTKIKEDLEMQNANLTQQEIRLTQQIQNLEGWLRSLEDRNKAIVNQPMLFYVGEILAAQVVEPGVNSDKAYEAIVEPLINQANETAMKRGARIPGKNFALRGQPKQIADICEELGSIQTKAVLRVVVYQNSVAGEPVIVNLELYPDTVIFKADEEIVKIEVPGSAPESELRDKLIGLLLLANNKAIEKGIITDGHNLRDIIPISEIIHIISMIKEQKTGLFKVSLVAAQDIHRVDPFHVKYKLTPLTN
ncbi:MAG: DUF3084 domain-containing protein [Firmicutes bacterium]|nr:DUF3084 domain-containing protein [Bacillota bacterium]